MGLKINFSNKFLMWIATFFGAGRLPKAPGTWGSLAALILLFFPTPIRNDLILSCIIVFSILSINAIKKIEKVYGKDPSFVVIDEVIGMWILMLSPFFNTLISGAICFFVFRMFDIFKPYPINKINNRSGAIYVLLDDIAASIYTIIFMLLVNKYLWELA